MADTKALPTVAVEYPSSDGRMIAELPKHGDAILYALATLRIWFARHDRVQVGASMFLYYQEGDNSKRVTLDLFVARGLDSLPPCYKLWEAGWPPSFVLEVAAPSTEERDLGEKQALYASIGAEEYWRFHPAGSLEGARRAGTRLEGGNAAGIGIRANSSEAGRIGPQRSPRTRHTGGRAARSFSPAAISESQDR